MTEFVDEPKSIVTSLVNEGYNIASLAFLCFGAIGIIYGDYASVDKMTTIGIVSLILAVLCKVEYFGSKLEKLV
jgi:multisubunit Na+/H+ antiporter MnhG subunit